MTRHVCALACLLLWTDFFPIDTPLRILFQEVKVEVCDAWGGSQAIVVSTRVYEELGGARTEIAPWKERERVELAITRKGKE